MTTYLLHVWDSGIHHVTPCATKEAGIEFLLKEMYDDNFSSIEELEAFWDREGDGSYEWEEAQVVGADGYQGADKYRLDPKLLARLTDAAYFGVMDDIIILLEEGCHLRDLDKVVEDAAERMACEMGCDDFEPDSEF